MFKQVSILGSGVSAQGAAILSANKGYNTFVSDCAAMGKKAKDLFQSLEIAYEEGQHTLERLLASDVVIKSPGIPDTSPVIRAIKAKQIPVISEIEFAGLHSNAQFIGITGSNGKTTTTLLTYHLLKQAGLKVGLAGNIGHSLAAQVATCDYDYYVVELSSFQLDDMFQFTCDYAVLLNITPDHLDRYDYKLENYIASKFRITNNQRSKHAFIYCADDINTQQVIQNTPPHSRTYCFSLEIPKEKENTAWTTPEHVVLQIEGETLTLEKKLLPLQGKHNLYNVMAACTVAMLCKVSTTNILQALQSFQGAEHRMEKVGTFHGISFINDSKATNVSATFYALDSMDTKIVWIAGGVDKGNDYNELLKLVQEKVHTLICLGKDNTPLINAFKNHIPNIIETQDMHTALTQAVDAAKTQDTVLLSPACASFDLFNNYEDRGTQFKTYIHQLFTL